MILFNFAEYKPSKLKILAPLLAVAQFVVSIFVTWVFALIWLALGNSLKKAKQPKMNPKQHADLGSFSQSIICRPSGANRKEQYEITSLYAKHFPSFKSLLTQISPTYPISCGNMSNLRRKLWSQKPVRDGISPQNNPKRVNSSWERAGGGGGGGGGGGFSAEKYAAASRMRNMTGCCSFHIFRNLAACQWQIKPLASFNKTDSEEYCSRFCLEIPSCFIKLRQASRLLSDTC